MMLIIMAWRNIWRNKTRSLVIIFSVAFGLVAGISVLALYNGMINSRINILIRQETGHLQIHDPHFKPDYNTADIIQNSDSVISFLRSFTYTKNFARRTIAEGMMTTTAGSAGVQINGVIPGEEYAVTQLDKKLVSGKLFSENKKSQIIIGERLAKKMKLKPGSKLVLTFTDTASELVSSAFKIAGVYRSENAPMDERNVYVTHADLSALLSTGNAFHEISIVLKKDKELNDASYDLKIKFPHLKIETWKELSPETELMINTIDIYSYIIIGIIMIALAFGIVNTMLMGILERTREIGMMAALGMSRKRIFLLVLFETTLLTITGTPVGIFSGWLLSAYYNTHGLDLSGMGKDLMSSFGYGTMIYPEFPADKLYGIILIVFCTAILSCILPSVKAIRLNPVKALSQYS